MRANLKEIRKHRIYSEEFKKEIVALFENGKFSVPQLEKLCTSLNSVDRFG